ncbi:hypothetical protein ACTJKC_02340 [Pedobacter sp. 22226]|uniref:hypothetical protein n=1 Tax=Pedobacter sp. 22226 TaxID=3453894 RepID=UPI003F86CA31
MSAIIGFTGNGGEDWFVSAQYGTKEIQAIPDPEGGHALNAPTSIPSPFARMDLVRKSFENIAQSPKLGFYQMGETVVASREDERAVSQCLDLAELLFFYENFKDRVEIIRWNKQQQVDALKESSNAGHRKLGDVLDMYLRQDAGSFNFNELNNIYIIKHNHRVIGGTSPLTLFFNAANRSDSLNLISTKGKAFFSDVVPLYERDAEFQKYIYLLFKSSPELGEKMKAFREYLSKNLTILSSLEPSLYNTLNTLKMSDLASNYQSLYTKDAGEVVEVFGVAFKILDPGKIPVDQSDFVIHSTKYNGVKPLVLQNSFNKAFKYVNGNWDQRTVVKYMDADSLSQRILPGLNIKYPYLTVSDFLEDTLIRMVYPIDATHYFDGNLRLSDADNTKSYLLPLKPLFFEFFRVSDLTEGKSGGPQITIEEGIKDSVRVLLKIPVKGGGDFIIFERVFYNDSTADIHSNKGTIVEQQFSITLFPFVKHPPLVDVRYSLQLIDRNMGTRSFDIDYALHFFSDNEKGELTDIEGGMRSQKVRGDFTKTTTKYFLIKKAFDFIQVDSGQGRGIIVPKWRNANNAGDSYTFAVDFGTTNSHIEYSVNGGQPRAFDITENDIQAVSLISEETEHNFSGLGAVDLRTTVSKEFIPRIIRKDSTFSFPIRTALSQSRSLAPRAGGTALLEFNIPFVFEKDIDKNSRYFTNLKWDSRESNNEMRIRAFIEQLMVMIRAKVILNGGNLEATKVIWTYPVSMSAVRKDRLGALWNSLYRQYINGRGDTFSLSESLAPYYYFKTNQNLQASGFGTSVLMDIGGGTSDVVVYRDNIPVLVSSYRFAGNTIFGDGFNEFGNIPTNMLVRKYYREFDELLNEHSILKSIADELFANNKAADFNAFLFSLSNNAAIKNKALLDYNSKLADDADIKIVFLYFYAAKIYHVAQVMRKKDIALPSNVIFSGNGSKVLNIISSNPVRLAELASEIFGAVYQVTAPKGLKVSVEKDIPKAITSKGSIIQHNRLENEIPLKDIKYTLSCVEGLEAITYGELLDETVQDRIISQVREFNRYFAELLVKFDCEDKFGISYRSIEVFREVGNKHLKEYLKAAIEFNEKMEGAVVNTNALMAETPFFLPLSETIQQLINALSVEEVEQ